jgi:hypothetical protein
MIQNIFYFFKISNEFDFGVFFGRKTEKILKKKKKRFFSSPPFKLKSKFFLIQFFFFLNSNNLHVTNFVSDYYYLCYCCYCSIDSK